MDSLGFFHANGCWPSIACFDFERDGIAFFEVLKADSVEFRAAEKYVFFNAFLADETAFFIGQDFLDDSLHT